MVLAWRLFLTDLILPQFGQYYPVAMSSTRRHSSR